MKKFFIYLKTRPLAFISFIFICILYFIMLFAEFIAPYSATKAFEDKTFHPANVKFCFTHGLEIREYRVLNTLTWKYAKVKGEEFHHKISFFVKGEPYKLFGFIPGNIHLFGIKNSVEQNTQYPLYLMGADNLGRDLFSRIVYGSRISLTIGFVASFISLLLAMIFGGLAGYYGGAADWTIMRLCEFFMLIPALYLILFLRSLLNTNMDSGQSYMIITLILALVGWPGTARTIRGMVHSIKREDFVQNAAVEGVPSVVIIFKHIIPQMASLLIVSTALSIPGFIMSETTLSYLGLGIADPAVSWGSLINRDISTLSNLKKFPWLLNPVWILLLATLAFNFIADVMRDFFDPHHALYFNWKDWFKISKKNDDDKKNIYDLPQEKNTYLKVSNLNVTFDILRGNKKVKVHAVRGINFELKKGHVLGVVGESGSGKSVSTTAITGLLPKNAFISGQIIFEGKNILGLSQNELRKIRGKKIGLIFQEPGRAFDPLQNIESAFYETFKNSFPKITKKESAQKALLLLDEVGISNSKERLLNYPHQFSGGQLQRICIALALAQDCQLLIADEVTTALDPTIQIQIVNLLLKLKKERDLSIIFISHNIDLVSKISDELVVMYGGLVMESGITKEIIRSPKNPYTKALLDAVPKSGSHYSQGKLKSIPGKVSDPSCLKDGCPFASRCKEAKEKCFSNEWNLCSQESF